MNQSDLTPITFAFYVDPAAALRAGRNRAGSVLLPIHDAVLSATSEARRALLAQWSSVVGADGARRMRDPRHPSTFTAVDVPDADTSPDGVARALGSRLDALVARRGAALLAVRAGFSAAVPPVVVTVDREALRVTSTLRGSNASGATVPVSEDAEALLILDGEGPGDEVTRFLRDFIAAERTGVESRVADALDGVEPAAGWSVHDALRALSPTADAFAVACARREAERREEGLAAHRAYLDAEAAARTAARAAEDRCRAAVHAFALTHPDTAPGAEDGYDMAPAVLDLLAARVEAALDGVDGVTTTLTLSPADDAWDATNPPQRRRSPSARVVQVRRAAVEAVDPIADTLPAGVAIEVSPVGRVMDVGAGGGVQRTAFTVLITTDLPGTQERLVVAWLE